MSQPRFTGGASEEISASRQLELLRETLETGDFPRRALIIPPDFTRYHSGAGEITRQLHHLLAGRATVDILPALGTHSPLTESQRVEMFGDIPAERFAVHDWREGIARLGEVPGEFVAEVSEGRVDYSIHAEVSRRLVEGDYDRIFSVGQVVPHEVIGMANHNKNIFVGTGGQDTIHKTHFLGAVAGMERVMGKTDSPVRRVLDYAESHFARDLPITYVLTVRSRGESGALVTRGLFIDEGKEGFRRACELSREVNLDLLDAPLERVVVYLDPAEFKSTWLGNKAVYRTRMALADAGELIILAPGLVEFGEDPTIDRLIREHGYRTTPEILSRVEAHEELGRNLSAAAHLIHGSSEGRFRITYAPGGLSREAIEGVGYRWADLDALTERYRPGSSRPGWNRTPDGEEYYFIENPALGLWALREKF